MAKPPFRDGKNQQRRGFARLFPLLWPAGLVFCVLLSVFRGTPDLKFCTDDAWISFRYAWNLVHGNGLTWNPGLAPVEGYSNLLWTLWAAIGIGLGIPVLLWCKLSGMAMTGCTVLATAGCTRTVGGSRPLAFAAALLVACSSLVVLWGISGMETPLLCVLLTTGTWRALAEDRGIRAGGRLRAWSLLLFGLAAITRVEGPLYLMIPVAIRLLRVRIQPLSRRDALHLLLLCAPAAGQFAFRLAYYGEWLSNTYVVKGGGDKGLLDWSPGVRYLLTALTANPWQGALWLVGGVLAIRYRHGALLIPAAVCAVFILRVGGDSFSHLRFIAPVVPSLTVAGLVGLDQLRRRSRRTRLEIPALALLVLLVLNVAQFDFRVHRVMAAPEQSVPQQTEWQSIIAHLTPPFSQLERSRTWRFNLLRELGDPGKHAPVDWFIAYLLENVPPGESFVFMDVGLVGYAMTDSSLLDGRGLNWRPMAHLMHATLPAGPAALEVPEVITLLEDFHAQRPAVLCLQNAGPQLFGALEAILMADGVLHTDYEFVARGTYWGMEDRVAIYRRVGVPRVSQRVIQQRYERLMEEAPTILDWNDRLLKSGLQGDRYRPEGAYLDTQAPRLLPPGDYDPRVVHPPHAAPKH